MIYLGTMRVKVAYGHVEVLSRATRVYYTNENGKQTEG